MDPRDLKMDESELVFWKQIRRRGAMWYLVNKGLVFLFLYPALGYWVIGWDWQPTLLVEGWCVGLISGAFVWMRKELRYRFTLEDEGRPLTDPRDE